MDIDCWLLVQSTTGEVARSFSKRPYWITRCYTIFGLIYSGTAVFFSIYTSMTYENSLGFARYRMSQKPTVFNTEILFLHYILEKMAISILFTYKPYQRNNLFCQLYLYDLWRTWILKFWNWIFKIWKFSLSSEMSRGPNVSGPKWVGAQMSRGPNESGPKWVRAQMSWGPNESGTKWVGDQMSWDPNESGPSPFFSMHSV